MDSKKQTGLLLVLGALVSFIGWFFIYPQPDGSDATAAEKANMLMADPALARVGLIMGFGGMWAAILGLLNIGRGMATAGGPGSSYANVSKIFAMILLTLIAVGIGSDIAVIDASSAALGASIMEISGATEGAFMLSLGFLLLLLGTGAALAKNFHITVAALAVVGGVLLILSPFVGMLGFLGWIGFMLTSLTLGILNLRSKS
ncbi:hypothetical protein M1O29_02445 [Dehalococcoidia bacterium]|nr:hypothetical protein [Dehalococcoidia bacterium]